MDMEEEEELLSPQYNREELLQKYQVYDSIPYILADERCQRSRALRGELIRRSASHRSSPHQHNMKLAACLITPCPIYLLI